MVKMDGSVYKNDEQSVAANVWHVLGKCLQFYLCGDKQKLSHNINTYILASVFANGMSTISDSQ